MITPRIQLTALYPEVLEVLEEQGGKCLDTPAERHEVARELCIRIAVHVASPGCPLCHLDPDTVRLLERLVSTEHRVLKGEREGHNVFGQGLRVAYNSLVKQTDELLAKLAAAREAADEWAAKGELNDADLPE